MYPYNYNCTLVAQTVTPDTKPGVTVKEGDMLSTNLALWGKCWLAV